MKYQRIIEAVFASPWAIEPNKMQAIVEFLSLKAQGEDIDFQAAAKPVTNTHGAVAVVPVRGAIMQRSSFFSEVSGMSSVEQIGANIRDALANDAIGAVILDIDSPGGSVYGVQELADEIYSLRGDKPIVAIANSMAASAAYWIASAADEFVVTPSGDVGSIGVLMMHVDQSGLNEKVGLNPTYIHAGDYKVEGNPNEPLDDDAMTFLQGRVDDYYQAFIEAVARNRGTTAEDVKENYGKGRVYGAQMALDVGMVDGIETLSETVQRLMPQQSSTRYGVERAKIDFL